MRMLKLKKELVLYCLSGGATTFVNYLIYFILLKTHVEYLAANTLAWAGAVVTAYLLNRRLVFHSRKHILQEFCSFVFLRFLTLLAENILLWIAVDSLGILPLPSKIMVSVITVLSNYVLCKYKIFHKEEVKHG
ncbi:cell wall teichoic acid glycosylation protein GtcA [Clostridium sp. D5]|nr:cell wall teichoic acid glycosylation protein GtcA [Clostridium sp. D5]